MIGKTSAQTFEALPILVESLPSNLRDLVDFLPNSTTHEIGKNFSKNYLFISLQVATESIGSKYKVSLWCHPSGRMGRLWSSSAPQSCRETSVKHNMKFLEMLVLLTYTTIENKQEVNNPNLKLKIICCGKISDAKGLLIHVRGQEALKVCSSSCAIVVLSSSSEHSSLNVVISTRIWMS